jgi:hypothetical protein
MMAPHPSPYCALARARSAPSPPDLPASWPYPPISDTQVHKGHKVYRFVSLTRIL